MTLYALFDGGPSAICLSFATIPTPLSTAFRSGTGSKYALLVLSLNIRLLPNEADPHPAGM